MNNIADKTRRSRRTFSEIDNDIMHATKELIEEHGFTNLTLRSIIAKAGIEAKVFYHRYKDLNALLEEFIRQYDYWFNDIISLFTDIPKEEYPQYFDRIITTLTESLYSNKSMQQILLWELAEDNSITRKTAELKEVNTQLMAKTFQNYFDENGIDVDFGIFSALIIGGIYYLILHKERSTFSGVDFNSKEGKARLVNTINKVISIVLESKSLKNDNTIYIARKLKNKGVDENTISESTGLSFDFIISL